MRLLSIVMAILAFSLVLPLKAEERVYGYDAIVSELSRTRTSNQVTYVKDPFSAVQIHAGLGLANTLFSLQRDGQRDLNIAQSGLQLSLGIDLFSRNWMAEGTIRNFGKTKKEGIESTLREFELKLVYRSHLNTFLKLRTGLGVSGRYLDLNGVRGNGSSFDETYTTPSTLGFLGMSTFITDGLSFGADISGRLSMISDTADSSSVDITLRMDSHF